MPARQLIVRRVKCLEGESSRGLPKQATPPQFQALPVVESEVDPETGHHECEERQAAGSANPVSTHADDCSLMQTDYNRAQPQS